MQKFYSIFIFVLRFLFQGEIISMGNENPLVIFVQKFCSPCDQSSETIAKIMCEISVCLDPQKGDDYQSVLLTDSSEDDIFKSQGDGHGGFDCPLLELKYILETLTEQKIKQEFIPPHNKKSGKITFYSDEHIIAFKKEKIQELKGLLDQLLDQNEALEAEKIVDQVEQAQSEYPGFLAWLTGS